MPARRHGASPCMWDIPQRHRAIAPTSTMQALSSSKPLAGGLPTARRPARRALSAQCAAAPVKEVLEDGSKGFRGDVPPGLNKYSGHITQPKSQGASQAMLYATGLVEDDMNKPQVGEGPGGRVGAPRGPWQPHAGEAEVAGEGVGSP